MTPPHSSAPDGDAPPTAVSEWLLHLGEEVSRSGYWTRMPDTDGIACSESLRRMFQLEEQSTSLSQLLERVHRADLDRVLDAIARTEAGEDVPVRFRVQLPCGEVRFVDARAQRRRADHGRQLLVGWIQDITETRRAEVEIEWHLAVSEALRSWDDSDAWMMRLLGALAEPLHVSWVTLWFPGFDGVLQPRWSWSCPGDDLVLEGPRLTAGRWLGGLTWRRRRPVWLSDAGDHPDFPVAAADVRAFFTRSLAVPLTSAGDPLGVISWLGVEGLELTDRLSATLSGLGAEIGAFLAAHVSIMQPAVLTPREIEILRLASDGLSGPAIAEQLCLSRTTVKTHFENIYVKYEVPDRVSAVAKAMREGLLA